MKSFLVIVAALLLSVQAFCEPVATLKPAGCVNDFALVLDAPSVAKLGEACRQLDERAHAQIVVVTVNSLDRADIYDYSLGLFNKWGIGKQGVNRGVLILLAIQDHRYRITVGSGLDSILGEGNVSGFGVEAVPMLRRNDYSSAASLMFSRVGHVIAENAGVNVPALDALLSERGQPEHPAQSPIPQPAQPADGIPGPVYAVAILGLAGVVYLLIRRGMREQSYSITDASKPGNVSTSAAAGTSSLLLNPTTTTSYWNPADTTSGGSSDNSPSFASGDSGFGSGDSGGSSCGGGDTGGGGAGGSW